MTNVSVKRLSQGVGGSHTRWQGKPPAHGVYSAETPEGQTAVTAHDVRSRAGDKDVVIDDDAIGPGSTPFKSEVEFSSLSEEVQEAVKEDIIEDFEDSDFFSDD